MRIKIGDLVKTFDGSTGKIVRISDSENERFPFVYEVDCKGIIHVTNEVTRLKPMKLADLIGLTHNL